mgnify:CR=1 FL=1
MKFEKITDSKIKAILTEKDMELNNISSETLFSNSSFSQQLLQSMLYEAEKQIGFIVDDSKLLIEAIMVSNEEFVFTITKLQHEQSELENNSNSFIFKFENFDNYISLCSFLNNLSDLNLSEFSKYFSLCFYNNEYYLYNFNTKIYSALFDYMNNIFAEFGSKIHNTPSLEGCLNEYGKIIFEDNSIVNTIFHFI